MLSKGASSDKKVRIALPSRGGNLVFKQDLVWLLQSIFRMLGLQVQIDGADSMRTDANGNIQAKINPGSGTAAALGLDVSSSGLVVPATIMGIMPTIGGTALDAVPAPALTIATSGTKYIVVTVAGTFDLKASTFVLPTYSGTPTVTIAVDTTDPGYAGTHNVASGTFKFLLATFVDGVKTSQNGHGPISAEICDNLKNEAKANLNLTWASA